MSDQREYPPGPEHPAGHPPAAVPAGHPGVRPGPPAPASAAPPRWPVPVARPSGPRPQPAGAVPLLTHEAAVGGWPSSGYPAEPAAPPGPTGNTARTVAARPRPGYGPPPGPPPARSGPMAGDGPRRPSGSGGGGRRWPRRLVWSLVALLGLGLLAPVVAFLVGWVMFDVPSANQTEVTQVATFKYADGDRAGHHPAGQRQPHDRHARPGARARPAGGAVGRGPVVLLQPRLRPDRHRPRAVEPGSPAGSAAARPSPSSTSRSPPGRTPRRCGASTRRSCSRSRSPRSRPRTRSSRTT